MDKPKTSRQLKQLILLLEEEVKNDRETFKEYFQRSKIDHHPSGMLSGLFTNLKLPSNIKTELIKTVLGFVVGFVVKKVLVRKVGKKTEPLDRLEERAIKNTVDKSAKEMEPTEREILKEWLHLYIISK